jgi:hypothetical protein
MKGVPLTFRGSIRLIIARELARTEAATLFDRLKKLIEEAE